MFTLRTRFLIYIVFGLVLGCSDGVQRTESEETVLISRDSPETIYVITQKYDGIALGLAVSSSDTDLERLAVESIWPDEIEVTILDANKSPVWERIYIASDGYMLIWSSSFGLWELLPSLESHKSEDPYTRALMKFDRGSKYSIRVVLRGFPENFPDLEYRLFIVQVRMPWWRKLLGKIQNLSSGRIDRSQAIEEALEKGAPAIEKSWGPTDYVAFAEYLNKIPKNSYPRVGSSKSRALFMKGVDSVEQEIFTRTGIHINERMALALQMKQAASNTMKRYYRAHNSGADYSTELIYLQGLSLSITRQNLALVDEFIPTIDPNDGKYEVRMQGLRKLKYSMAGQLIAAILSLQEIHAYSDAERRILSGYLAENFLDILDHLDQSVQREIVIKLEQLKKTERDVKIRKRITELLNAVEQRSSNKNIQAGSNLHGRRSLCA
jgi:hypothetical protein